MFAKNRPNPVTIRSQQSAERGAPAVFYVRVPGLLARAAWEATLNPVAAYGTYPLAVNCDNTVRDLCPLAARLGVRAGQPERHARRACPTLHVVSASDINPRRIAVLTEQFLRPLAEYTNVIEPDGADGAYGDFTAVVRPDHTDLIAGWNSALQTGFTPHIGWGTSRNSARACAEEDLAPNELFRAHAQYLWPEDPSVYARLFRLGSTTYGAVASIGESALVYQFGKKGRLIHARSMGHDFTPVRALFPRPEASARYDFSPDPIEDEASLMHAIGRAAADVSTHLRCAGQWLCALRLLRGAFGRVRFPRAGDGVSFAPLSRRVFIIGFVGRAVRLLARGNGHGGSEPARRARPRPMFESVGLAAVEHGNAGADGWPEPNHSGDALLARLCARRRPRCRPRDCRGKKNKRAI